MNKETQLRILNNVLKRLEIRECEAGLCLFVSFEIQNIIRHQVKNTEISKYIPLFTKENAIIYANAYKEDTLYWWDMWHYDIDNRVKFINWIIKELNNE